MDDGSLSVGSRRLYELRELLYQGPIPLQLFRQQLEQCALVGLRVAGEELEGGSLLVRAEGAPYAVPNPPRDTRRVLGTGLTCLVCKCLSECLGALLRV